MASAAGSSRFDLSHDINSLNFFTMGRKDDLLLPDPRVIDQTSALHRQGLKNSENPWGFFSHKNSFGS